MKRHACADGATGPFMLTAIKAGRPNPFSAEVQNACLGVCFYHIILQCQGTDGCILLL
ncbi:Uncharacterised protein [Citrobacter koseri]|nr:Uncharacterised protein [Citrobacter koseri]